MIPPEVPCRRCGRPAPLRSHEIVVRLGRSKPAAYWYAAALCQAPWCHTVTQYAGLPAPGSSLLYYFQHHFFGNECTMLCRGRPRLWRPDWGRPSDSSTVEG